MSLSSSEAAREARSEAARHAITARWARTTDPDARRAELRPARIAAAVKALVDEAPALTDEQRNRLRVILAQAPSGGGADDR